jgi:DNA-binding NtrC family response regulator
MNYARLLENYPLSLVQDPELIRFLSRLFRDGPEDEVRISERENRSPTAVHRDMTKLFRDNLVSKMGKEDYWSTSDIAEEILFKLGIFDLTADYYLEQFGLKQSEIIFARKCINKSHDFGSSHYKNRISSLKCLQYSLDSHSSEKDEHSKNLFRQNLFALIFGTDPDSDQVQIMEYVELLFKEVTHDLGEKESQSIHEDKFHFSLLCRQAKSEYSKSNRFLKFFQTAESAFADEETIQLTWIRILTAMLDGEADRGVKICSRGWKQTDFKSLLEIIFSNPVLAKATQRFVNDKIGESTDNSDGFLENCSARLMASVKAPIDNDPFPEITSITDARIKNIVIQDKHQDDDHRLNQEIASRFSLVGVSGQVAELKQQIVGISKTDSRVLISGPIGSGKEALARSIWNASNRSEKPFVKVNCAAFTDFAIESRLFGSEHGAYSGATPEKGQFELADGGTLFLDEVEGLSLAAQAKVLQVLETGTVTRLGSNHHFTTNVRVISATNQDLLALVNQARFRKDLFYRLATVHMRTTPLKERKQDIPFLINHCMRKLGKFLDVKQIFSPESIEYLQSLPWNGNVRELNNLVERLFIFWDGGLITRETILNMLPPDDQTKSPNLQKTLKESTAEFESEYIRKIVRECNGDFTEASKRLGIDKNYLESRLKKIGADYLHL